MVIWLKSITQFLFISRTPVIYYLLAELLSHKTTVDSRHSIT